MKNYFQNMVYSYIDPKSYMDFLHVDFCFENNEIDINLIETINKLLKEYNSITISEKSHNKGWCKFKAIDKNLVTKSIIIYKDGEYKIY